MAEQAASNIRCNFCTSNFSNVDSYIAHLNRHRVTTPACPVCDRCYTRNDDLSSHLLDHDILRIQIGSNLTARQLSCTTLAISNSEGDWLSICQNSKGVQKPSSISQVQLMRMQAATSRRTLTPLEHRHRAAQATAQRAIFIRNPPTPRQSGFRRRNRPAETAPYRRATAPQIPGTRRPTDRAPDRPPIHGEAFIGPPPRPQDWRTPPPSPVAGPSHLEEGEIGDEYRNLGESDPLPPLPTSAEIYSTINQELLDLFGDISDDSN